MNITASCWTTGLCGLRSANWQRHLRRAPCPVSLQALLPWGGSQRFANRTEGVRGIVVGSVLQRLIGRTLAAQFGDVVQEATAPFQLALRTRAGADALALT